MQKIGMRTSSCTLAMSPRPIAGRPALVGVGKSGEDRLMEPLEIGGLERPFGRNRGSQISHRRAKSHGGGVSNETIMARRAGALPHSGRKGSP